VLLQNRPPAFARTSLASYSGRPVSKWPSTVQRPREPPWRLLGAGLSTGSRRSGQPMESKASAALYAEVVVTERASRSPPFPVAAPWMGSAVRERNYFTPAFALIASSRSTSSASRAASAAAF
jgi:hypothetical protein